MQIRGAPHTKTPPVPPSFLMRHGRRAHRHVEPLTRGVSVARPPRARLGLRVGGARPILRSVSVTPRPRLRPALFWRVAAGNAAVLAAACVITALAFRNHASDVALRELAIFGVGLALM